MYSATEAVFNITSACAETAYPATCRGLRYECSRNASSSTHHIRAYLFVGCMKRSTTANLALSAVFNQLFCTTATLVASMTFFLLLPGKRRYDCSCC